MSQSVTDGIKSSGYCGGDNLKKYGLKGDKQRYYCKDCKTWH